MTINYKTPHEMAIFSAITNDNGAVVLSCGSWDNPEITGEMVLDDRIFDRVKHIRVDDAATAKRVNDDCMSAFGVSFDEIKNDPQGFYESMKGRTFPLYIAPDRDSNISIRPPKTFTSYDKLLMPAERKAIQAMHDFTSAPMTEDDNSGISSRTHVPYAIGQFVVGIPAKVKGEDKLFGCKTLIVPGEEEDDDDVKIRMNYCPKRIHDGLIAAIARENDPDADETDLDGARRTHAYYETLMKKSRQQVIDQLRTVLSIDAEALIESGRGLPITHVDVNVMANGQMYLEAHVDVDGCKALGAELDEAAADAADAKPAGDDDDDADDMPF